MKKLKDILLEKLVINKDIKSNKSLDISNQWADKDEWTKYKYDALYYILNLIKDKVDWNSETKNLYSTHFQTSLTAKDIDELNKTFGKDNILDSHEWNYDWNKKSYLTVTIFKEKLIDICNSLMHQNIYNLTLNMDAANFYEKYYNNTI